MRNWLLILVLTLTAPVLTGCAEILLIAGGLVALSEVDQQMRAEQFRKDQREQQQEAAMAAERQRHLAREEAERHARLAEQNRIREEQARLQKEAESRRIAQDTANKEASNLLAALESSLKRASWTEFDVASTRKRIALLDQQHASESVRARLHLAAGLHAYLLDHHADALREFGWAKRLGASDPKVVASTVWSPGALEAFARARAD